MAEERTLGLARAREGGEDDLSKAELQRRMEQARDSISNTVTEIKDNVAQQVETVKDALDWREHFKKRPVAWSLGAAGVGFFVGYGIASAITGDDEERSYSGHATSTPYNYVIEPDTTSRQLTSSSSRAAAPVKSNGKDEGPGMLERFKETSAYDRLSKEAGALGDRLIDELSTTAQVVVLPALLKKVKEWIGVDLSEKSASMGSPETNRGVSGQTSTAQAGRV